MEELKDLRKMSFLIFVEESTMIYRMYKGEMDIYVIRFHAPKCNMETILSAWRQFLKRNGFDYASINRS